MTNKPREKVIFDDENRTPREKILDMVQKELDEARANPEEPGILIARESENCVSVCAHASDEFIFHMMMNLLGNMEPETRMRMLMHMVLGGKDES